LVGRDWAGRSYREALADLLGLGWLPCGVGDWAVALRSPGGLQAARVCPFDPAYEGFLELCRRCSGNRYLPRVELEVALAGSGSVTVLEFLTAAPDTAATTLVRQWEEDRGDAELAAVKSTALAIDGECRARVPWWDGIDMNPGNIRLSAAGGLRLIDIFCMDGAALYGQVRKDAAVVRHRLPESAGGQLLEIPYLARETGPRELHALREAWLR
jgi:hypothetical protein